MKKTKFHPTSKLDKNTGPWHNRVLLATPTTGSVRMEWVLSRYGQLIPTNWSHVELIQWINSYIPQEYLLPDAENLIAREMVQGNYEWLFMIEQDNILPQDTFFRMNEYMKKADTPVVSGLYFTKSNPPEPILYKGRGNGYFGDFKMGDKVWVDGVPFGCILIHGSIIRAMWDESEEYVVNGQVLRKVFSLPDRNWGEPGEGGMGAVRGTTDLQWCTRVIEEGFMKKAGWDKFAKKKFPFLVDTNIFVKHITNDGVVYPLQDPKTIGY